MLTSLRELRLLVVGSGRCYQFDLVLPLPSIDGRLMCSLILRWLDEQTQHGTELKSPDMGQWGRFWNLATFQIKPFYFQYIHIHIHIYIYVHIHIHIHIYIYISSIFYDSKV